MEQYFEITKESKEYDNYFRYVDDTNIFREIVNNFCNDNNISSDEFGAYDDKFWIVDNSANREQFGSQLAKNSESGMVSFKKNSQIGRAWNKLNVKIPNKPFVPFFFQGGVGRMKTRLFHVNDKVYCSIKCVDFDMKFTAPVGFVEIKASEFFKIIEDNS